MWARTWCARGLQSEVGRVRRALASKAKRNADGSSNAAAYEKLSPIEHVLRRPEVYLGPMEPEVRTLWLPETGAPASATSLPIFRPQKVEVVPAFLRICDEILVNASDNVLRGAHTSRIEVTHTRKGASFQLSVKNDGFPPPLEMHPKEKMLVPEMLFGTLLTGSNFDLADAAVDAVTSTSPTKSAKAAKRFTGGRHGYGAKLTNIMSHRFRVHISDPVTRQTYTQRWTNNMQSTSGPLLEAWQDPAPKMNGRGKGRAAGAFTLIEFEPDLSRFGMTKCDDVTIACLERRVWDLAACLASFQTNVLLNGRNLSEHVKSFASYAELHGEMSDASLRRHSGSESDVEAVVPAVGKAQGSADRCAVWKTTDFDVVVREQTRAEIEADAPDVSFVNCVHTHRGGKHVQAVRRQLVDAISKTFATSTVKPSTAQINQAMMVFVNARLDKPHFESQSKEMLSSHLPDHSSKGEASLLALSNGFVAQVLKKTRVLDTLRAQVRDQEELRFRRASKSLTARGNDAQRRLQNRLDFVKLEDADAAGHSSKREAQKCTLILTEGDSARATALAGLSVLKHGRKYFGVFPLRGKPLNVRECSLDTIRKNAECMAIIRILGLKAGEDYSTAESRKTLRYGKVMIMADQDYDGDHIKGLLLNFFDALFPSLLKPIKAEGFAPDGNFVKVFNTPLIKAFLKGKDPSSNPPVRKGKFKRTRPGKESAGLADSAAAEDATAEKVHREFFQVSDFEKFFAPLSVAERKKYQVKYYKGLGTSTRAESQEYFKALEKYCNTMAWGAGDEQLLDMAFNKHRADDRKQWMLGTFNHTGAQASSSVDPQLSPFSSSGVMPVSQFVMSQLREFSLYGTKRSLPSVIDGLKPATRKILYAAFKKQIYSKRSEMKVSQLSAFTSEITEYRHGEDSLNQTVIRMAQGFVGSNNYPLLQANGQFGTRLVGGADAAAPRYLYTFLSSITPFLFRREDEPLLEHAEEDGSLVEPVIYFPIVPVLLLNGVSGIGIGWSTEIPGYRIESIVANLRRFLDSKPMNVKMVPFVRGFKGTIEQVKKSSSANDEFVARGVLEKSGFNVHIKELPPGVWTETYRKFLDSKLVQANLPLESVRDLYTDTDIHFHVTMSAETLAQGEDRKGGLHGYLNLENVIRLTNMHAFDVTQTLRQYSSPYAILEEFAHVRLAKYAERKAFMTARLEQDVRRMKNRVRFVRLVCDGELRVLASELDVLVERLEHLKFDRELDDESGSPPGSGGNGAGGYGYLLKTDLLQLTKEKAQLLYDKERALSLELEELRRTEPQQMWARELDELMAHLGPLAANANAPLS
ncbi:DNA topoisomerase 2 [Porphyridium purpureum]|uniref:DNA topoisomerase 2 n=1 Tax=Porphyridium purpureum TaxID=35688 RepID=A0A5J4Z8B4_PORPP|nr:DNA topoisomerase 2 [Porphyridium purpureum]|eukprot:POR5338..scf295_1